MLIKTFFILIAASCAFELGRIQASSGKGLIEWCRDAVIVAVALLRSIVSVITGGRS